MPKFFVMQEQIKGKEINIIGEDVNHIKNVLRKKVGEQLIVCNKDNAVDYLCQIVNSTEKSIKCQILEKLETNAESDIKISIWQGIPKADKMELVIQKSVELGVYDITPIEMQRCVVKLTEKDKSKKIQRWQKIAEVAAKQSERNKIPDINPVKSIKNICKLCKEYDIVIVAYEKEKENKLKKEIEQLKQLKGRKLKIAIVIGPEGGIDETEIKLLSDNNARIVTLGKRILRTETVALYMLSVIMYEFES